MMSFTKDVIGVLGLLVPLSVNRAATRDDSNRQFVVRQ